jgi:hypothetical protein
VAAKGHSDHHRARADDRTAPEVQMDYQYLSTVGELCAEEHAKAVALTVVDCQQGYVGLIQVTRKGLDTRS